MITLTIPGNDTVEERTFAAGPITMGLQKALARYARDAGEAARKAVALQDAGNTETVEGLAALDGVMDSMVQLNDAQAEILIRAFDYRFGPEEIDRTPVDEVVRVITELQERAYGVVRKNA